MSTSSSTAATTVSSHLRARHTRRIHQLGPLQTIERYWSDIEAGKYAPAFQYLALSSVPQSQSQFVSDEQEAGIDNVHFSGQLSARTGSSATIAVASLTTQDAQFGCRNWTGSYQLSKTGPRWLVWLLPAPVRAAHIATTRLLLLSIVERGPSRVKSAPAAQHPRRLVHHILVETSE